MKFLGSAKLSTKRQVTLPIKIVELLKLAKGDDLIFLQDERGLIFITKEVQITLPEE